ncbi:MAG TPA: metallophosphoesterase [Sphingobacteriaceae bacterium]
MKDYKLERHIEVNEKKSAGLKSVFMSKSALLILTALCFTECKEAGKEGVDTVATGSPKQKSASTSAEDFTIAVIPDTQYYTSSQNGGTPAMFTSQIDWIKANRDAENIVYVVSLGDITDHGDTYTSEWTNASTYGYYKLETPITGFPDGIPYGTCVGNHDQSPNTGHPLTCSTAKYNQYFGRNHFASKAYYGGNYAGSGSNNNDSHYDLFSAGGKDFIVIYTEYDSHGDDGTNMNNWVYNLLGTYSNRKAIIVSHMMTGSTGAWHSTGSTYKQGEVLYNRIKSRPNVFMMLCGHVTGESFRQDTYNGNTIRTFLSDYQGRTNGGNGYMRLMKFSVDNNSVSIKTYSPHLGVYETDANSQFIRDLFGYYIIDNFEVGTSHFNREPTYNCSTVGISTSSSATYYTNATTGGKHLKVNMIDNTSVLTPWKVRLLSGSGLPVNNVPISKNGTLSIKLFTSTAQPGATVRIWLDDVDGNEQSQALPIINDGAWHTYTWNLANFGGTAAPGAGTCGVIGGGNGAIDGAQVTLDGIVFEQPNTSATWSIYVDDITK